MVDVQKAKCVVVLSGGSDSTVVAFWAKNKRYDVRCISFKYGQIAEKETHRAKLIAKTLDTPIKVIDLSGLKEIFVGVTSLCDRKISLTSEFSVPIIVPFRNAILLSVAVSYAVGIGALKIFYGAHGSDIKYYPDCREEFCKSLQQTSRLGTEKEIEIQAPFCGLSKSEILKIGQKLRVPFRLTWSCYLDNAKHCGKCESCINRKEAFKEAGIKDPTQYMQ